MLTNKQQHSASETPLSPVQERFWILEQLATGNPVYHVSGAFRLSGALQEGIFRQALSEIVRRHEVLRTRFLAVSGRPSPTVSAPAPFELRVVDLQEFAASQREKEVQRLAFEQARRPFRLEIDLMLRATLVRMGKAEHVLIVTLHRLAADVDSVHILLQELVTIYDTFLANHDSSLPEPPLQYIEFAGRQRRWLTTDAARKDLAFWKQRLEGMPSLFELPIGRARPGRPTYQSSRHPLKFSPSMAESLVAFAVKEKCDLATVLLGAFEAVLARYSARQDIILGVVASHRTQAGAQALIGNFSNTLVLRTKLENDLSFAALTNRLMIDLTEARAHAEFPFARVVEELNPPRDRSYHPLVQIRFDFGEIRSPIPPQGSLQISLVELDCLVSEFDLTLRLERTAQGLEGWLEYATDLMDRDAIVRMAGHLETILKGILENPAQPLHRLPMLTEPERGQLLVEWNDTQISFPQ